MDDNSDLAYTSARFQQIKTLPGLPREEEARGILEELAADPGVRAVMEKHRWTVGTLCELYPEGKVSDELLDAFRFFFRVCNMFVRPVRGYRDARFWVCL